MGFLCVGAKSLSAWGSFPSLLGGPPARLAVPVFQALAAATALAGVVRVRFLSLWLGSSGLHGVCFKDPKWLIFV